MSAADDQCKDTETFSVQDFFNKSEKLLEKLGASDKCKQAAKTWATNNSASWSVDAKAQAGWGAASGEVQSGGQISINAFDNYMSQEGCSPISTNLQNVYVNSKKFTCILQKAQNQAEFGSTLSNTLSITTLSITPEEIKNLDTQLTLIEKQQPPTFAEFKEIMLSGVMNPSDVFSEYQKTVKLFSEIKDKSKELLIKSYNRDINITNSSFNQTINGKMKMVTALTSEEQSNLQDISKQIASGVAQQEIELKGGLNALNPSVKNAIEANVQNNQNLTNNVINNKVQSIKQQLTFSNTMTISAAGNINMNNVRIDQNILFDICSETLINNAISTGLQTASELLSDSKTLFMLKSDQKGLDDLVDAQGRSNAASIGAAKVPGIGGGLSLGFVVFVIFLIVLSYRKPFNVILAAGLGVFITIILIALIVFVVIFASSIGLWFRRQLGTETEQDQLQAMARPLELYQKIWKSFGCTKDLTRLDVMFLKLEKIKGDNIVGYMEFLFTAMISNQELTTESKNLIFKDGVEPVNFLPRIKTKNPVTLLDSELKFIWDTDGQCIGNLYFDVFMIEWNSAKTTYNNEKTEPFEYLTYLDLIVSIRNFQVEKAKLKTPSNLTKDDLEILWVKYGKCNTNNFTNVKLDTYQNLTNMEDVLNDILSCKTGT
jgi:hypothetical protein